MALKTLGTNANNSLQGFLVGFNDTITADLASIGVGLRFDPPAYESGSSYPTVATTGLVNQSITGTVRSRVNQPYIKGGLLMIPKRGLLRLKSGDFVCWDTTTGWPIVVSGDAAANGPYTHT